MSVPLVVPEVEPEVLSLVEPEVEPDVLPEVEPDVEPEVLPLVEPDVVPLEVPSAVRVAESDSSQPDQRAAKRERHSKHLSCKRRSLELVVISWACWGERKMFAAFRNAGEERSDNRGARLEWGSDFARTT